MREEIELIIQEGLGDQGFVSELRQGVCPGAERLTALIAALQVVAAEATDWKRIDRELAAALHTLSFEASGLIEGWERQGKTWQDESLTDLMPSVYELVDEVFGTL